MKLHELNNSLDESLTFKPYSVAKQILESNGFEVIRPFDVKTKYLEYVNDKETAHKLHLYNPFSENDSNEQIKALHKKFDNVVLKDVRHNTSSWETLNSYLDYRSGCIYNWVE